uniref:Disease resistance R13L4/SHOC-2-like LRR domain-containing protein n=1 Tax=Salix viminalis TaxID=40686 RepID=A0A6N2L9X5_SALVM
MKQMLTIKLSATAHFLGVSLWANYLSGNIPPEWADTKLELLNGTQDHQIMVLTTCRIEVGVKFAKLCPCSSTSAMFLTAAKANYHPYGIDFPNGTAGRYTNGRTMVDIIGAVLGFNQFIPPFATARGKEILVGVNYASGAAGIRDESGRKQGVLSDGTRIAVKQLSAKSKQGNREYLKRQDLDGSLPKAIQKLPHLKELSLWANYLSGNIPSEWADTKLELLSLGVNRLNGTIPSYLGNITTLRSLNIENNMFSGTVPPELGDLVNLENLSVHSTFYLSANNLSGELPLALANLIRLKELRLSRNNFTGRIPEFIQSWKQLDALEIQAGGFIGPIPSNISLLTNLTDLYSMHINCGGPAATIGKTIYEADDEPGGAAKYVSTRRDWQKSTTGHIWDVKSSSDSYIAQNMSILRMDNSVLYTNASLTLVSHILRSLSGKWELHCQAALCRDSNQG